MTKKPDAQAFLAALQGVAEPDEAPPPPVPAPVRSEPPVQIAKVHTLPKARTARAKPAKPSRADLKHFGGYLGDETLEKIALLRVRLKLDNSELITLAIDELHRKHTAKRAFGDA